ncbi:DinB superfamily protein [Hymenobacter daecheongensis DSM 21074]|uniref:DinB superfamily protein n=1 Tax=Hymenobacter daecheongensis DSM 21074 TaxID=1121955 RepID=A0A1M6HTG0_9BACT|nr:DinB family protein [Hymenobacter daecheongensis]SHJ25480.1 DinB superfamily protein [Hymenobacter daecheongensis DSM 21074]
MLTSRPQPGQYVPYFDNYISRVPVGTEPLAMLAEQPEQLRQLIGGLSEEQALLAYAPGKWTIKEMLLHLIDTERIMAYRALRIARGDQQPLPGFDENAYAAESGANERPLSDLLHEYDTVRQATRTLFGSFSPAQLNRAGTASNHPITVRALLFVVPGHEAHHVHILRERYLPLLH